MSPWHGKELIWSGWRLSRPSESFLMNKVAKGLYPLGIWMRILFVKISCASLCFKTCLFFFFFQNRKHQSWAIASGSSASYLWTALHTVLSRDCNDTPVHYAQQVFWMPTLFRSPLLLPTVHWWGPRTSEGRKKNVMSVPWHILSVTWEQGEKANVHHFIQNIY